MVKKKEHNQMEKPHEIQKSQSLSLTFMGI